MFLQGYFEELLVWNCYIDFDQFIDKIITPSSFLSLKKAESNADDSQFYISYNHIDDIVEIICDINIDNNISKEILNELLDKLGLSGENPLRQPSVATSPKRRGFKGSPLGRAVAERD